MFDKVGRLWMWKTRPALDVVGTVTKRFKNGDDDDGNGDKDGDKDKPTVEDLQKRIEDMKKENETYRTEKEQEVSGLIKDLQSERVKAKKPEEEEEDEDADKTFLTKKQVADLIATKVKEVSTGLVGAYSEDRLSESVDKAKVKYTEKGGHIPYTEVIEKGFLEFCKRNPQLLAAMKTATDPAEFAYTIGMNHPVFAARRKAKVTKEIVEEMNKPKITPIVGADGKTEVTEEAIDGMSAEEYGKLPDKTRQALLMGSEAKK